MISSWVKDTIKYLVGLWITLTGFLIVIVGLTQRGHTAFIAMPIVLMGILYLPPVQSLLERKVDWNVTWYHPMLVYIGGLLILGLIVTEDASQPSRFNDEDKKIVQIKDEPIPISSIPETKQEDDPLREKDSRNLDLEPEDSLRYISGERMKASLKSCYLQVPRAFFKEYLGPYKVGDSVDYRPSHWMSRFMKDNVTSGQMDEVHEIISEYQRLKKKERDILLESVRSGQPTYETTEERRRAARQRLDEEEKLRQEMRDISSKMSAYLDVINQQYAVTVSVEPIEFEASQLMGGVRLYDSEGNKVRQWFTGGVSPGFSRYGRSSSWRLTGFFKHSTAKSELQLENIRDTKATIRPSVTNNEDVKVVVGYGSFPSSYEEVSTREKAVFELKLSECNEYNGIKVESIQS